MLRTRETKGRRSQLSVMAVVAILIVSLMPGAAQAQTGWSTCPNSRIVDNGPALGFPVDLPPGVYEIEVSVNDGYADRPFANAVYQSREQVRIILHTADGPVASAPTPDLEDGVAEVFWQGSVGQVLANSKVSGVEITHIGPRGGGGNSLNVECVWLYRVVEIPMFPVIPTLTLLGATIAFLAVRRWMS